MHACEAASASVCHTTPQVSAPQGAQAGRSHIGLMAGTRPGGCVSSSSMFGRGRGGGGGMPAGGRGKASAEQAGIKSFFTKQTR